MLIASIDLATTVWPRGLFGKSFIIDLLVLLLLSRSHNEYHPASSHPPHLIEWQKKGRLRHTQIPSTCLVVFTVQFCQNTSVCVEESPTDS